MYFQAISNQINYEVNVTETLHGWAVSFRPEGGEWAKYEIPRDDYQYMDETISLLFKNQSYLLDVTNNGIDYTVYTRGAFRSIKLFNEEKILQAKLRGAPSVGSIDALMSEMPGKITKIYVQPGDSIKSGEPLLIMEAMKMENELRASADSKIKSVHVQEGQTVESNTLLISFDK